MTASKLNHKSESQPDIGIRPLVIGKRCVGYFGELCLGWYNLLYCDVIPPFVTLAISSGKYYNGSIIGYFEEPGW
jgi:hypothetical protein